ncbi:MAG TPA: glycosyltransferase family 10 [Balneolales bacterium]|nr:glycosyltransferase family 10 [Balneolales bacterium]
MAEFFNSEIKRSRKLVRITGALLEDGELFLQQHSQFEEDAMPGYGGCLFTLDPVDECDALVVFNTPPQSISVKVPYNNVFAFMQEPGQKFVHPWMFDGLDSYYEVYSPKKEASNVMASHGFLGWSIDRSLNELIRMQPPVKTRRLSCMISNAHVYPGHRRRLTLIYKLITSGVTFDLMGRGFRNIDDKWEALAPYRFSIALENASIPHYFTEKISDCFLARTLPVYWGCTNLDDYFPPESFIRIDVEKPRETAAILESLDESEYLRRLPALEEARRLVLDKYNPLARIDELLRNRVTGKQKEITINPILPDPFLKRIYGIFMRYRNYSADWLLQRYRIGQMRRFAEKSAF